ncbi:MAG TPA: SMI1/KNR4 family protein [Flavobacterium sp.]|jgi:hypothetical protein
MEIKYLKKLENTPKITDFKHEGASETEIQQLEEKLSVKLPQAYKEFLYLAGKFDDILGDWNRGFDDLEFIQEYAADAFKGVGLQMRPFWCFAEYCDADSSLFFFLDEGDDPPVYNFVAEKIIQDENGDEIFYKRTHSSFTEYIQKRVTASLK